MARERHGTGRRGPAGLGVAALVLVVALAGCGFDWTSRLGDRTHGAYTPDSGLTAANVGTLREQWRLHPPACNGVTTGASWFATPVTFHGVIYLGSNFGCLHAIDEHSGAILWTRFHIFQPELTCSQQLGIVSSIRVTDDGAGNPVLYFHSPDGYLYKLRGSDGSTIWRKLVQIPSASANDVYAWSSPTVENGKVIVGVSSNCDTPFVQGQVRAYDAGTGALLWVHKTIPDGFAGAGDWYDAAVDDAGDVYVTTGSTYDATAAAHPNTTPGFEQYSLLKLDGDTGRLLWKAPAPEYVGDPDYATSPILFRGGGLDLVGGFNKDGWFRTYRRDTGAEVWQAYVGSHQYAPDAALAGGGVFDGTRLFVVSNATRTGGSWTQPLPGVWVPSGGVATPGSIRELNPRTGALMSRKGAPFEIPLPADAMGPCSLNGNGILVCAGGRLVDPDPAGHDNGLYVVDTNAVAGVLRHLEDRPNGVDTINYGEFSEPVQEWGAILAANNDALVKWGQ
jgi:outer membrane protein assembly factor BamB